MTITGSYLASSKRTPIPSNPELTETRKKMTISQPPALSCHISFDAALLGISYNHKESD
jgi:hypothetical protein